MYSFSGIDILPSVEAMIILFPDDDLPNSFEMSTVIVNILPFNFISQFFNSNVPPSIIFACALLFGYSHYLIYGGEFFL